VEILKPHESALIPLLKEQCDFLKQRYQ